ncbi:MAG: hypothetical protein FWG71_09275, partial [Synergistaceae bacterium]|nr:hypothetical protein [Synergistaceae bacterium]
YKGRQPTTRYEMASALARALAVVDMTKASKQDVEMLKRLVIEFKDELDALGVKVDELDERVAVLEERLGGWKVTGAIWLDLQAIDTKDEDVEFSYDHARLFFERWFGEDESMYFFGRVDAHDGGGWSRFYVEFPAFFDTTATVGRFAWNWESAYYFQTGGVSDLSASGPWLTDVMKDGFGLRKDFGFGAFQSYIARVNLPVQGPTGDDVTAFEIAAVLNLQPTEQIGVDLGGQYFLADDATANASGGLIEDNFFTLFGGIRFDFNENIGLRGMYYYQDDSDDNYSAYRAAIDLKQDLLKFTSLWLSYEYVDTGFTFTGDGFFPLGSDTLDRGVSGFVAADDTQIFNVGATQRWNDKWSTWAYFGLYNFDVADASANIWGLGVEYRYNPFIGFALNYANLSADDDLAGIIDDNYIIRFRTAINF